MACLHSPFHPGNQGRVVPLLLHSSCQAALVEHYDSACCAIFGILPSRVGPMSAEQNVPLIGPTQRNCLHRASLCRQIAVITEVKRSQDMFTGSIWRFKWKRKKNINTLKDICKKEKKYLEIKTFANTNNICKNLNVGIRKRNLFVT